MTMDIIDDIVHVIRALLDYLGFDVDHMERPIWQLPTGRGSIRTRSLIRRIGSRLPLKPACRVRIQGHLLGKTRLDDSFDSALSRSSSTASLADLIWVEEDLGDNCYHVRAEKKHRLMTSDLADLADATLFNTRHNERTSTPVSFLSHTQPDAVSQIQNSMMSADSESVQKISALESELARLREQIAMIVLTQEQTSKTLKEVTFSEVSPPPACPPPPPPPPPPPAPPAPSCKAMPRKSIAPGTSLADMLKQNKESLSASEDRLISSTGTGAAPSMADVLKGLGNVKLKSVRRSPGGTPFRVKPLCADANDPAALIARALKRKFASNRQIYSPDMDKENDSREFDSPSPHTTPKKPTFGQHLLRKSGKRVSKLCEEENEVKGLGPLREINA